MVLTGSAAGSSSDKQQQWAGYWSNLSVSRYPTRAPYSFAWPSQLRPSEEAPAPRTSVDGLDDIVVGDLGVFLAVSFQARIQPVDTQQSVDSFRRESRRCKPTEESLGLTSVSRE